MVADRFMNHVDKAADGCWLWTGTIDRYGYGKFKVGMPKKAHRVAYELFVGPIGRGRELHHTCNVTRCVNPDHLVPMTRAQHARLSPTAQRTHCAHGHPFTPENTYIPPRTNTRECRVCNRAAVRRYQARKAAA